MFNENNASTNGREQVTSNYKCLFKLLLNSLRNSAFVLLNHNNAIVEWNNVAEELFGIEQGNTAHAQNFYIPPIDAPYGFSIDGEIIQTTEHTWAHLNNNGKLQSIKSTYQFLKEDEDYYVAVFSEPVLGNQYQNFDFKQILDSSESGITLLNKHLEIVYRNSAAEKITGWQTSERTRLSIFETVLEDDKHLLLKAIGEITSYNKDFSTCKFRSIKKDGEYFWIECTFQNLLSTHGANVIVCRFQNISQKKDSEEILDKTLKELYAYKYALDESSIVAITDNKGKIKYVNKKFTDISGYTEKELIGQDHKLLNSGSHNKEFFKTLWRTIAKGNVWKGDIRNKAKNGDYYWVDTTIIPFFSKDGKPYQYVAIRKDITTRKNAEQIAAVLSEISLVFNENTSLTESLQSVTEILLPIGNFSFSEIWLIDREIDKITQRAKTCTPDTNSFYYDSAHIRYFAKSEGLPGVTWESGKVQHWENIDVSERFIRRDAAKNAGIKAAFGIPLVAAGKTIGAILLGFKEKKYKEDYEHLFLDIGKHIGTEIQRKQFEEELNQIFNFAPDVICLSAIDGFFKRVNPAMCNLLEYSEEELLTMNMFSFIHPQDIDKSNAELLRLEAGTQINYFENRFITRSGKTVWLAWTSTPTSGNAYVLSVAKNITQEKELQVLLQKASQLAKIGEWEIDVVNKTAYWSPIAKEIHGFPAEYRPIVNKANSFYRDEDRHNCYFIDQIKKSISERKPFDIEMLIRTPAKTEKWIRVLGEPEFVNKSCIRLYGSFQDIHDRKQAEQDVQRALDERNHILESIKDGFFAVDNEWKVTYWNKVAAQTLKRRKTDIKGKVIWTEFPDNHGVFSYDKFQAVVDKRQAAVFEQYDKDGDTWYEVRLYPLDKGLSVYFQDITDRKKDLAERLNYITAIEQQNMTLRDIAWMQSHVVRAPLAKIIGLISLISDDKNPPEDLQTILTYLDKSATDLDIVIREIIKKSSEINHVAQVVIQPNKTSDQN